MNTYYFDMKDGVPVRDKSGLALASDGAAIAHSKHLADKMRKERRAGNPDLNIVVIDESGREVHREQIYPQAIAAKGALAVIPNNPSRALKYPLDKHLYAQRHLVECCFSKLKQFRRVATRFEKTVRNYRAVVTLAAIILWLR